MQGRPKAKDRRSQGNPKGTEHVYGFHRGSIGVSPKTSPTGPWIPEGLVKVRRVWGSACLMISLVMLSLHVPGPRCERQGLRLEIGNKKVGKPLTALGMHCWEQSHRVCNQVERMRAFFSASLHNSSVATLLIFPNNLCFYIWALNQCWQRFSNFQNHQRSE